MRTITTTDELTSFCQRAAKHPYVTVDTEFLRERTYYSKLCLVQLALPEDGEDNAVLIDPLAPGISLDPLFALMGDTQVVKVFHAARQDVEIFYFDGKVIPQPLFDTQVAAMVCGYGDQVGYETLVRKIAKQSLDKSSRFTDWSHRPLSKAQMRYALADVTHLRIIYEELSDALAKNDRAHWLEEEMAILTSPKTYENTPEDAWRRVKTRTHAPRFLGIVKELAAFREEHAQSHDVPRNRVFKDDALVELASAKPKAQQDLDKLRLLQREARKGAIAQGILQAVAAGLACPEDGLPNVPKPNKDLQVNPALAELLRVLLKAKSDNLGVAAKLIASAHDLDEIAGGGRNSTALTGWRYEVFGADALRLCDGRIGLYANGNKVDVFDRP